MAEDLRDCLLASYADMGEAMVAQNVLEVGGVSCRIGDLAHIPSHLFGMAGGLGRSVGLWVLDIDVERASSLLATGMVGIDEAALISEALATAETSGKDRNPSRCSRRQKASRDPSRRPIPRGWSARRSPCSLQLLPCWRREHATDPEPAHSRAVARSEKLGDYPRLGKEAARRFPHGTLLEFPELCHAPQIQDARRFHEAVLKWLVR